MIVLSKLFFNCYNFRATTLFIQLFFGEGIDVQLFLSKIAEADSYAPTSIVQVAYSPDGNRLAAATTFGIWLFDAQTYEKRLVLRSNSGWDLFNIVVFSPEGKMLASGAAHSKEIQLWNPITGEKLTTLIGHTERVSSIAFSPDGETLASGSYDKTILLWDVPAGKPRKTLNGHTD